MKYSHLLIFFCIVLSLSFGFALTAYDQIYMPVALDLGSDFFSAEPVGGMYDLVEDGDFTYELNTDYWHVFTRTHLGLRPLVEDALQDYFDTSYDKCNTIVQVPEDPHPYYDPTKPCSNIHCVYNSTTGSTLCIVPNASNPFEVYLDGPSGQCKKVIIKQEVSKIDKICVYPRMDGTTENSQVSYVGADNNPKVDLRIMPSWRDPLYSDFNAGLYDLFLDYNTSPTDDEFNAIVEYLNERVSVQIAELVVRTKHSLSVSQYRSNSDLVDSYYQSLLKMGELYLDGYTVSEIEKTFTLQQDLLHAPILGINVIEYTAINDGQDIGSALLVDRFDFLRFRGDLLSGVQSVSMFSEYQGITLEKPILLAQAKLNATEPKKPRLLLMHRPKSCSTENDGLCGNADFNRFLSSNVYVDLVDITAVADFGFYSYVSAQPTSSPESKVASYELFLRDYLTNMVTLNDNSNIEESSFSASGLILNHDANLVLVNSAFVAPLLGISNINNMPIVVSFGTKNTKESNGSILIKDLNCEEYLIDSSPYSLVIPSVLQNPLGFFIFGKSNRPYLSFDNVTCNSFDTEYMYRGANNLVGDDFEYAAKNIFGLYGISAYMLNKPGKEQMYKYFEVVYNLQNSLVFDRIKGFFDEMYPLADNTSETLIDVESSDIGMYFSSIFGNNNDGVTLSDSHFVSFFNIFVDFKTAIKSGPTKRLDIINNSFVDAEKAIVVTNGSVNANILTNLFIGDGVKYEIPSGEVNLGVGKIYNFDLSKSIGYRHNPLCGAQRIPINNFTTPPDPECLNSQGCDILLIDDQGEEINHAMYMIPIYYKDSEKFTMIGLCCLSGNYYGSAQENLIDTDETVKNNQNVNVTGTDDVAEKFNDGTEKTISYTALPFAIDGQIDYGPLTFKFECGEIITPPEGGDNEVFIVVSGKGTYTSVEENANFDIKIINSTNYDVTITSLDYGFYAGTSVLKSDTNSTQFTVAKNYTYLIKHLDGKLSEYDIPGNGDYTLKAEFDYDETTFAPDLDVADKPNVITSDKKDFSVTSIKKITAPDNNIFVVLILLITIVGVFVYRKRN